MHIFKSKQWVWSDILLLKWSSFMAGLLLGALFSDIIRPYVWLIGIASLLFALRPAYHYFQD